MRARVGAQEHCSSLLVPNMLKRAACVALMTVRVTKMESGTPSSVVQYISISLTSSESVAIIFTVSISNFAVGCNDSWGYFASARP